LVHQQTAAATVGLAVGGDHLLVDPPGDLDGGVLVDGEQGFEPVVLAVGEQVGAGVQRSPCPVERVVLEAAVTVQLLLDPTAAAVQRVPGQANDVERVMPTSA
jgi:hypothetical protein